MDYKYKYHKYKRKYLQLKYQYGGKRVCKPSSEFWEFIKYLDWVNKPKKVDQVAKMYDSKQLEKFIKTYNCMRYQIRDLADKENGKNQTDFGGGDDFVGMDLPDSIIVRGKKFYTKMISDVNAMAKFGRTEAKELGLYAFFNDLEDYPMNQQTKKRRNSGCGCNLKNNE